MNTPTFGGPAPAPRASDRPSPVEHFRGRCARGEAPDPTTFLADFPDATPLEVVEILLLDQRARWGRGDRQRAEAYLAAHPAVRADEEATLDLVYGEFLLAEERGEQPDLEEYAGRFPELAGALRVQVALHRALPQGEMTPAFPQAAKPRPQVPGYQVEGELGRGGAAVVYKAWHPGRRRHVALKVLRAGAEADPDELARFRREAEAVARLQHPNLVQIYDIGEFEGLPYVALECVAGGSLDRWAAGRPQPVVEAASLVQTLARAIHAAHQRGIIHRDLKPANILLQKSEIRNPKPQRMGSFRISDFGFHAEGGRLRPRQAPRHPRGRDAEWRHHGHARLHGPGTGAGPE